MHDPVFACDAMLGGLAKWLRAAGYDASAHPGIDDWDLIRHAREEKKILLSSDSGIFKIGIVRDGGIISLFIPRGMKPAQQLATVLRHFHLSIREPRCMKCGGELKDVPKAKVEGRVPARTYGWIEQFYECQRCSQIFWKGTHWKRISRTIENAARNKE